MLSKFNGTERKEKTECNYCKLNDFVFTSVKNKLILFMLSSPEKAWKAICMHMIIYLSITHSVFAPSYL